MDSTEAMTAVAIQKEKALSKWRALLAGFNFRQGLRPEEVIIGLKLMAEGHVKAFQLALMGTGYATIELEADGDPGNQTRWSLQNLGEAAGFPHPAPKSGS